jgi:polyphosphate kinase
MLKMGLYGIVRFKAHAKAMLIVRREGRKLRRYVHLGTGNYHTGTTRAYTDLGLMTCDKQIGEDVHRLFAQLTGLGGPTRMRRLLQSPFTLRGAHRADRAPTRPDGKPARSSR